MWFDCFFGLHWMHFCLDPSLSLWQHWLQLSAIGETDKEMHPNCCLFPCIFLSPPYNSPLGRAVKLEYWIWQKAYDNIDNTYVGSISTQNKITKNRNLKQFQMNDAFSCCLMDPDFRASFSLELVVEVFPCSQWLGKDEGSGRIAPPLPSVTFPPFCHRQYQSEGSLGC